mgnify:CR=1 FL=1
MLKKKSESSLQSGNRRRHWRDRRTGHDRRNSERLNKSSYDCRDGSPRRAADISGELSDGEIWWNKETIRHE